MKTPAVIASLTVAGSIAFAAGQQSANDLIRPDSESVSSPDAATPEPRAAAFFTLGSNGCPDVGSTWFSQRIRPLDSCSQTWFTSEALVHADVDNDGRIEYFARVAGILLIQGGLPTGSCLVEQSLLVSTGDLPAERTVCVADSADLAAYAAERFPGVLTAQAYSGGWRDMDNDDDLDLVVFCYADVVNGSFFCWLENTGFQKQPRLVGDLNADGKVNGADLGTLLVNWTP
jgi:hypothetical protein